MFKQKCKKNIKKLSKNILGKNLITEEWEEPSCYASGYTIFYADKIVAEVEILTDIRELRIHVYDSEDEDSEPNTTIINI